MSRAVLSVSDLDPKTRQIYFDIKTMLDSVDTKLPRVPELVKSIDTALNDDNMTINDIADIVRVDPTIAGRIIQIANSPLVRGVQQIDSLSIAIGRIGLNFVRNLIFCMGMQKNIACGNPNLKEALIKNWKHSVSVMALSFAISQKFPDIDSETAMVVGIIHDIGFLPVYVYADEHNLSIEETHALGTKLHALLGVDIVSYWDMSDIFKEAIMTHHHVSKILNEPISYATVVAAADIYATRYSLEYGLTDEIIDKLLHKLSFTRKSLATYLEDCIEKINELIGAIK
jgi:HD-like signal output (HDOD) protein